MDKLYKWMTVFLLGVKDCQGILDVALWVDTQLKDGENVI